MTDYMEDAESEEFEDEESQKKGKKSSKSKKSRRIEFDEDLGMTIAKKKHKRGGDDEEDWSEWIDI